MIGLIMAVAAVAAGSPTDIAGHWKTQTRGGIVEISHCGQSICGRIVTSEGIAANPNLTDARNRDVNLRGRPLKGMQILGGFKGGGTTWTDGTIYNAEDGKTYDAKLMLIDANTLRVRGCVFVPLCKTQTWRRAQ